MASRDEELVQLATERGQLLEKRRLLDDQIRLLEQRIASLLGTQVQALSLTATPVRRSYRSRRGSRLIVDFLNADPTKDYDASEIASAIQRSQDTTRVTLSRLTNEKKIIRTERGRYASSRANVSEIKAADAWDAAAKAVEEEETPDQMMWRDMGVSVGEPKPTEPKKIEPPKKATEESGGW
jgi:hypothetical protein